MRPESDGKEWVLLCQVLALECLGCRSHAAESNDEGPSPEKKWRPGHLGQRGTHLAKPRQPAVAKERFQSVQSSPRRHEMRKHYCTCSGSWWWRCRSSSSFQAVRFHNRSSRLRFGHDRRQPRPRLPGDGPDRSSVEYGGTIRTAKARYTTGKSSPILSISRLASRFRPLQPRMVQCCQQRSDPPPYRILHMYTEVAVSDRMISIKITTCSQPQGAVRVAASGCSGDQSQLTPVDRVALHFRILPRWLRIGKPPGLQGSRAGPPALRSYRYWLSTLQHGATSRLV